MAEGDLRDGLRLSRASGWNQTFEDWRLLLSLGPGLFRVAVLGGRVVASGGAVRYGEELAWICMILVEPGQRGRGLGTRIFDEVLDRVRPLAEREEVRAVGLDATPAGRGIYLQRGFVDAAASSGPRPGAGPGLVRMRTEETAGGPSPEVVRPLVASDLDAVLALDRKVFGADRAALLRRALAEAPGLARVARAGRVRGYCFGRHGDHADHVGPVMAEDRALARDLVAACRPSPRPLVLDARAEPGWLAALSELGFREQRPLTRMYLGDRRPLALPALEPAVRGPEFG